jgi:hypothetical protein
VAALWVKRNSRGECLILYPRGRGAWNPHPAMKIKIEEVEGAGWRH